MSDLLDACIRRTVELVALAKPDLILTDPRLKELINSSYETIVLRLANQGLNSLRQEIVLEEIRAGTTELTTTSDPAIPEISQIIRAWERAYGGTSWTEMRKVIDHLPVNATPASNLIWYDFRNGALQFVGSTGANDVKLHFAPRAASFTMPRDAFAFPDLVNPVAFMAASRACGGFPFYDAESEKDLFYIASLDSHSKQSNPVRLRRRRSGTRRY